MTTRIVGSVADSMALTDAVSVSAHRTVGHLSRIDTGANALSTLWEMKFKKIGCDPLNPDVSLNLIEQLNQTFTYLASARAARILLGLHPELAPFTVNLGTAPGSDIESSAGAGLAAEVFAAVKPSNNGKLAKDINKVRNRPEAHKYVFFMCPGYPEGRQRSLERGGDVEVWSVGGDL